MEFTAQEWDYVLRAVEAERDRLRRKPRSQDESVYLAELATIAWKINKPFGGEW